MLVVPVVAAVIIRDGKVLLQKRSGGYSKGKWELPGGKVEEADLHPEPSLAFHKALCRELDEELHVQVGLGYPVHQQINQYGEGQLNLVTYYYCSLSPTFGFSPSSESTCIWTTPNGLVDYDILPGTQMAVSRAFLFQRSQR